MDATLLKLTTGSVTLNDVLSSDWPLLA